MATLTLFAEPGVDWKSALERGRRAVLSGQCQPAETYQPALEGWAEAPCPSSARRATASEDLEWIGRVQGGDEDAACGLVERLYPTIIRMVRSHLPRRTHEDDLVQAVFAKVFGKLEQFSGLVPLEHWVARIAINTCLNQLKHELVRPELRMSDLSEEQEAVVERLACASEDLPGGQCNAAREVLDKLLAQLSPEDRLVITLLHLEERSTEEISRLTGWSVSWVKVRAFRARHKMREVWNRLFHGEPW